MKGVFLTEEQVKLMREALDYGRSTMPKNLYDKTISFLTPIEIPKAQILRVTGQRSICDCNLSNVEEVKADKRMQKFIKSAKMVYKMGSCSDVPCADCPWYNEHMHSTFRAEPDYDRSELDSKNARRRAAARWLIAHDITEVDGEPIVVEPPQILEPQKKDKE